MSQTNFDVARYLEGLRTLMQRQGVDVAVRGFEENRDDVKLEGPTVEFADESIVIEQSVPRALDVLLTGNLIVMLRADVAGAEGAVLELALDVATSLVDETEHETEIAPVFGVLGGTPIRVLRVEPFTLDGPLGVRTVSRLITYEQGLRISRNNHAPDPAALKHVHVGRVPKVGPPHAGDYEDIFEGM